MPEIFGSPSEEIRTTAAPGARFHIEDMRRAALDWREAETFTAYLVRADRWYIGVIRPGDGRIAWVGIAGFPLSMEDLAVSWYQDIENDTDIENLMREWGGEDLQDEFEAFVVAHGD
jgi:hypothetical protein